MGVSGVGASGRASETTRRGAAMAESEWDERGLGQEPGADVGDDGDIPDDPLLEGATGSGEPLGGLEGEEDDESGLV